MIFQIACLACAHLLDVDVEITQAGSSGSNGGPYETSYPGEGCEWEFTNDVICDLCGRVHTPDEVYADEKLETKVQEYDATRGPYDDD